MTRLTWKKVASAGIRTHQLQFDARPDLTYEFLEPLSRGKAYMESLKDKVRVATPHGRWKTTLIPNVKVIAFQGPSRSSGGKDTVFS